MKIGRSFCFIAVALTSLVAVGRDFYQPDISPSKFGTRIDHPYFPLVPGTVRKYVEKAGGETSESEVIVIHERKEIMGVSCIGVREVITHDGAIRETTLDWYAQDNSGAVWHFGEATQEHKAGGRISREGSWEAGVNGAQPGIVMPNPTTPGQPYRQEYFAGKAEDMGQVISLGQSVTVPAGTFHGCLLAKEWSLLESGTERKWYAQGVGVVQTQSTAGETATLLSITRP